MRPTLPACGVRGQLECHPTRQRAPISSDTPPKKSEWTLSQRAEVEEEISILVVDDHRENRVALRSILGRRAYEIVEAASGEDALKLILKFDFAVVLLDVNMPVMNGLEAAQFVRSREASKDVPII